LSLRNDYGDRNRTLRHPEKSKKCTLLDVNECSRGLRRTKGGEGTSGAYSVRV